MPSSSHSSSSARRTNDKNRPNALSSGTVKRTMWPPGPGTQRWLKEFGESLVCVRHREDPAGIRRIVTVELIMGPVGSRLRQKRLAARSWYPIMVDRRDRELRAKLRENEGYWDAGQGLWYLRGGAVLKLGLEDRIAMQKRRETASLVASRAQAAMGSKPRQQGDKEGK